MFFHSRQSIVIFMTSLLFMQIHATRNLTKSYGTWYIDETIKSLGFHKNTILAVTKNNTLESYNLETERSLVEIVTFNKNFKKLNKIENGYKPAKLKKITSDGKYLIIAPTLWTPLQIINNNNEGFAWINAHLNINELPTGKALDTVKFDFSTLTAVSINKNKKSYDTIIYPEMYDSKRKRALLYQLNHRAPPFNEYSDKNCVHIISIETAEFIHSHSFNSHVTLASFSPQKERVCIVLKNMNIKIWNPEEKYSKGLGYEKTNHTEVIIGAIFSPSGTSVISYSEHECKIWDVLSGSLLYQLSINMFISAFRHIAISENERYIAIASELDSEISWPGAKKSCVQVYKNPLLVHQLQLNLLRAVKKSKHIDLVFEF